MGFRTAKSEEALKDGLSIKLAESDESSSNGDSKSSSKTKQSKSKGKGAKAGADSTAASENGSSSSSASGDAFVLENRHLRVEVQPLSCGLNLRSSSRGRF